MRAFTTHTGVAAPLRLANVSTDQILPSTFLKGITRADFAPGLFAAWRTDPQFVLNQSAYRTASILVAAPVFGTGSSREHAVWALCENGFRVVVSSAFAEIFRANALNQGLLTAQCAQDDIARLWAAIEAAPGIHATVDLTSKTVTVGTLTVPFAIDDYARWRLLEGLDEVGLTLADADSINRFEEQRSADLPSTTNLLRRDLRSRDRIT